MAQLLTAYIEIPGNGFTYHLVEQNLPYIQKLISQGTLTVVPILSKYYDSNKFYFTGYKNFESFHGKFSINMNLCSIDINVRIRDSGIFSTIQKKFLTNGFFVFSSEEVNWTVSINKLNSTTPMLGIHRVTDALEYVVTSGTLRFTTRDAMIINQCVTNRTSLVAQSSILPSICTYAKDIMINSIDKLDIENISNMLTKGGHQDSIMERISNKEEVASQCSSDSDDDDEKFEDVSFFINDDCYGEKLKEHNIDITTDPVTLDDVTHKKLDIPQCPQLPPPDMLPVIIEDLEEYEDPLTALCNALEKSKIQTPCTHTHQRLEQQYQLPTSLNMHGRTCLMLDSYRHPDLFFTWTYVDFPSGKITGSFITNDIKNIFRHRSTSVREIMIPHVDSAAFGPFFFVEHPYYSVPTTVRIVINQ